MCTTGVRRGSHVQIENTLASSDKSVPNNGSRWRVLTQSQSVALKMRQTCSQKGEQTYTFIGKFTSSTPHFSHTDVHVVDFIFIFIFFSPSRCVLVVRSKIPSISRVCRSFSHFSLSLWMTLELDMLLRVVVVVVSFFFSGSTHIIENCIIMYKYISLDVIVKFKYWIPIEKMNKDKSGRSFFFHSFILIPFTKKIQQKSTKFSDSFRLFCRYIYFICDTFFACSSWSLSLSLLLCSSLFIQSQLSL